MSLDNTIIYIILTTEIQIGYYSLHADHVRLHLFLDYRHMLTNKRVFLEKLFLQKHTIITKTRMTS